jgi:serine protease Do
MFEKPLSIASFRKVAFAATASISFLAGGYASDRGQQFPVENAQSSQTIHRFPIEMIRSGVVYINTKVSSKKEEYYGTGFAISPDIPAVPGSSYIATACHVVSHHGGKIFVQLANGDAVPASVIGCDKAIDTAVLKIPEQPSLTPLEWGDSEAVNPGDPVYVYGNPADTRDTLTKGIVSAHRHSEDYYYPDVIQTDAAINSGNSGGPSFNESAQVLGLVSYSFEKTTGLNFVIAASVIRKAANDMINFGRVKRGDAGFTTKDSVIKQFGIEALGKHNGALVVSVRTGSAAAHAGFKKGDVVTAFNNAPITDAGNLLYRAYLTHPGDPGHFTIVRNGQNINFDVIMDEASPASLPNKAVKASLHGLRP